MRAIFLGDQPELTKTRCRELRVGAEIFFRMSISARASLQFKDYVRKWSMRLIFSSLTFCLIFLVSSRRYAEEDVSEDTQTLP
jgi:hypothetical protein